MYTRLQEGYERNVAIPNRLLLDLISSIPQGIRAYMGVVLKFIEDTANAEADRQEMARYFAELKAAKEQEKLAKLNPTPKPKTLVPLPRAAEIKRARVKRHEHEQTSALVGLFSCCRRKPAAPKAQMSLVSEEVEQVQRIDESKDIITAEKVRHRKKRHKKMKVKQEKPIETFLLNEQPVITPSPVLIAPVKQDAKVSQAIASEILADIIKNIPAKTELKTTDSSKKIGTLKLPKEALIETLQKDPNQLDKLIKEGILDGLSEDEVDESAKEFCSWIKQESILQKMQPEIIAQTIQDKKSGAINYRIYLMLGLEVEISKKMPEPVAITQTPAQFEQVETDESESAASYPAVPSVVYYPVPVVINPCTQYYPGYYPWNPYSQGSSYCPQFFSHPSAEAVPAQSEYVPGYNRSL